jgi:hypothetical protein
MINALGEVMAELTDDEGDGSDYEAEEGNPEEDDPGEGDGGPTTQVVGN